MATPTIKSCFSSGATAFLANMLIYFIIPPLFILTSNLLPGFAFGFVLLGASAASTVRKLGFLLISGGLFIAAAFLVTGHSFAWQEGPYMLSLASITAAICLLVSYKLLLDNAISLNKGIPLVAGTGLLAALVPTMVMLTNSRPAGWLAIAGVLSVYITWQTLFGWVLNRAKAPAVATTALIAL